LNLDDIIILTIINVISFKLIYLNRVTYIYANVVLGEEELRLGAAVEKGDVKPLSRLYRTAYLVREREEKRGQPAEHAALGLTSLQAILVELWPFED
jgi:hypothetical protein